MSLQLGPIHPPDLNAMSLTYACPTCKSEVLNRFNGNSHQLCTNYIHRNRISSHSKQSMMNGFAKERSIAFHAYNSINDCNNGRQRLVEA